MKQLLLLFAMTTLFGCTKERISQPPPGTWTIVETNDVSAGYVQIQTYVPSTEVTLEFGNAGNLILTGSNPGVAKSPLWEYDKYQMLEKNIIRFYQSTGNKERQAYYEVEGNLYLNYFDARHGYEEQFLRVK